MTFRNKCQHNKKAHRTTRQERRMIDAIVRRLMYLPLSIDEKERIREQIRGYVNGESV